MANLGIEEITIEAGDRIAQLRIVKRIVANFIEANDIGRTSRGGGGFGSTGG
jgi:dUTP pyrophosphatase